MTRLFAIFLYCLPVVCFAGSPQPYFRHYGVEQGLSNNRVRCTLQDRFGFLWVGTADGLNRFDGYQFRIFRNSPGDGGSLGDNYINSLVPAPDGALLVATNTGLYRFDYATEKFRPLVLSRYPVGHMATDRKGRIWYVAHNKLKCFDPKERRLHSFVQVPQASSVAVAADGSVWASSADGYLYQYLEASHRFRAYNLFAHSRPASAHKVQRLYPTSDTCLLVGTTNQGAKKFSIAKGSYEDLLTHNEEGSELLVFGFLENGPSEYWIASETGIYTLNPRTHQYRHMRKGFTNPFSLSDNDINTLCADREGGIWAGTNFGGLNYFPKQQIAFERFFPGHEGFALGGNVVHEITADKWGQIWIGTEDAGLSRWNPATGKTDFYLPTGNREALAYSNIHGLVAADNELWIGTFEHGLDVLDIPTGKVLRHYNAGKGSGSLGSNFIVTLYRNRAGEMLVGTWNGLYRYRRASNDFEPFLGHQGQVQNICEDADGAYWICTLGNGVFYYNPTTGQKAVLQYRRGKNNSLANNNVHGQYHDGQGNIWFSTESGLSRYEKASGRFRHFTTEQGLPGNVVYRVEEDRQQRLWITTTKGLGLLHLATGELQSFSIANGLPSDHFNFNSSFQDSSGRIYLGTLKGMVSFQPAQLQTNPYVPPLYFTQVLVNNTRQYGGNLKAPATLPLPFAKALRLPYHQSTFSIDFAALGFAAPEMTRYRYQLEGLDNAWTLLASNRRIYFTSLQPGSYTLRLQVLSPTGTRVLGECRLSITIMPPWWASPLAYAAYLLLAITGLLVLLRYYHRYTRERARRKIELIALKKEKELYEAKMDFFTNVAHEIRTPLTLIKAPLERVLHKTAELPDLQKSLRTMERNTDRLIDLTGQLLDFRKAEANGFQLQFVNTDISRRLAEHFAAQKPLAEQRNLNMSLRLPAKPILGLADGEALNKIFSNLLHNAIKYAQATVRVVASSENDHCTIQVLNDGPLVPPAMREQIFEPFFRLKENGQQGGTGIGLALARSLAQLHGGSLVLQPHESLNVFVLELPLPPQSTSYSIQTQTQTSVS
ncbi:Signal transduction histidine kinase [Cnuella takakiae]|uniref:histidine kinase n=1 Tax=Cnuella takakiae TaxID=1302690 RepID=A0A1M5G3E0_9BACT|nr:two-component regulator propeller domain-containing protein [Cnuella takakiae]OLY92322.1 hypothetical protein BUE76_10750 [Cnuella takakiae]SHF98317.1 Signal transduction histidine kinase [Cnuella takakiae]